MIILCDKSGQCGVGDIVGCVEAGIEERVSDKEPCVLGCRANVCRDAEDGDKSDGAAKEAIEHPWTGFAHFRMCLVDQRTEENITHTIKEL